MKGSSFCALKRRFHIKMTNLFKRLLTALFLLATAAGGVQAAVTSVTTIPSQVSVSPTGGSINITWRVVHSDPTGPFTLTTSSPSYTIIVNANPVLTVSKTLSRTTTLAGPSIPETLTFSEVIPISPAIAKQIATSGNNAFIQRVFNDTLGGQTHNARLVVGGAAGALNVQRLELSFENGGKTKVIGQNSELRAVAEVNFRGNGLLEAEWRLVDSSSIRGGRFERRLAVVRRQLTSSGNGRTRIVSPRLPTGATGLHEIKLVMIDPETRFEEPVLRYYINPNATSNLARVKPLEAFAPREGVPFGPETLFDWHPVAGAAAYQVELFNLPGGSNPLSNLNASQLIVGPLDTDAELVIGKIVPGEQTSATFASFSEQHLKHGYTYLWRIRAIGANGTVVGQSDFRKILYP